MTKAEHPAIRASCHCLVVAVGIILVVLGVSYQNFFLVYPGLVVSLPFQIGALLCAIYGMCIGRVKQGLALLAGLSVLCILFYLGFMLVLQHHVDTTLSGIQQQMQEMQKQMMPQLPPLFKLPSR